MESMIGFLGLGFLLVIQIAGFAYFFGKLSQKSDDQGREIKTLNSNIVLVTRGMGDMKLHLGKINGSISNTKEDVTELKTRMHGLEIDKR